MKPEKRLQVYKDALHLYKSNTSRYGGICPAILDVTENKPRIFDEDEDSIGFDQKAMQKHYPEFVALKPDNVRFGCSWWNHVERCAAMKNMISKLEAKLKP